MVVFIQENAPEIPTKASSILGRMGSTWESTTQKVINSNEKFIDHITSFVIFSVVYIICKGPELDV
jgi:hypothetical protein